MGLTAEAVRAARSPQEAMFAIAEALDRIEAKLDEPANAWESALGPQSWISADPVEAAPFVVELDPDAQVGEGITGGVTIEYKLPLPHKLEARRAFAKDVLELDKHFPEFDAIDAYSKGGPLWLYHGNRDFFMSYAVGVRQAMVADVDEDDPPTAQEMGRDVLKEEDPGSPEGMERALAGTDLAKWSTQ